VIPAASFGDPPESLRRPAALNVFFAACQAAAQAETSDVRLPAPRPTVMWCAIVDREGVLREIRATDTGERPGAVMDTDAWRASIEIAIAKAFTAVSVSSNEQALTSADVGGASQPGGPLWGIGDTNPYRPLFGTRSLNPDDLIGKKHHGIVTFGGGVPIYSRPGGACDAAINGTLLGAVGVSGDSVPDDITVATNTVINAGFCTAP
jgi:uncharacterized protein GlcG (DUF336 family)